MWLCFIHINKKQFLICLYFLVFIDIDHESITGRFFVVDSEFTGSSRNESISNFAKRQNTTVDVVLDYVSKDYFTSCLGLKDFAEKGKIVFPRPKVG